MSKDDPTISPEYSTFREIDRLLEPGTDIRDKVGNLCRAMLICNNIPCDNISNSEAIALTLANNQSSKSKSFYAATYLRLLSAIPSEFYNIDPEQKVVVTKLFNLLPQVSKYLEINHKLQGYERIRALEDAASKAEAHLKKALVIDGALSMFNQARQNILHSYKNPLVTAIIVPFLPDFLAKKQMEALLESVYDYLSSNSRERLDRYSKAREMIEAVLSDCKQNPTHYTDALFLPFFTKLLIELNSDFESSSMNKPGMLSIRDLRKQFPFSVSGADIRLGFAIDNAGAGVALNVEVSVDVEQCLLLPSPLQFLDEIEPGSSVEPVEFYATVQSPVNEPVWVTCKVDWTNGDGSKNVFEEIFELPVQRSDIPWDNLETTEPYSLEPVRRAEELVGRSEQLMQLVAKLKSPSVGSFWIYGQRRVGKTSVVKTLDDIKDLQDLTIIYLETGMFIVPDVAETVNNLGRKICNRLIQARPRLSRLHLPNFEGALAPLDDFLLEALAADKDLRIIVVLDEFDSLPVELYRRGPSSHAFFLTLRSLSGNDRFGFICVGGESMAEILSTQGQHLNKFRPLRIDYLDRQSQWSDFVELARRPVEEWATINDDAVIRLYEETSGNPFFTKFVCGVLVADMLRRRDAYVTAAEMDRAIQAALREASMNQFQHFWDDGIPFTSADRTERERAARRRVLVALGETLRTKAKRTPDNISQKTERFGIGQEDVLRLLCDFEKRKVLIQDEDGFRCKVGLFERWLVDEGLNNLSLSLIEEDDIRREIQAEERKRIKSEEIIKLTDRWGSYRGNLVTGDIVRAWLDQFESLEHQRLMFDLLTHIRFYSGGVIREKLREGHGIVLRDLASRGIARRSEVGARKRTDNILISYYGDEGKRGHTFAKLYADENKIYQKRITTPRNIVDRLKEFDDVEGIVFVDDFIGTGRTARESLAEILAPLKEGLKSRDINVFSIAIAGFGDAGENVERHVTAEVYPISVSILQPLDASDKCFSEISKIFPDPAIRQLAKQVAHEKGVQLTKGNPLGFGNCQCLVVFELTCPNNCLPILWSSEGETGWRPLFPRP